MDYYRMERLKKEYCGPCRHYRPYRKHGVPCIKDVLGYVNDENPCKKRKLVPGHIRDATERINANDNLSPYDKIMAQARYESIPLLSWFQTFFSREKKIQPN